MRDLLISISTFLIVIACWLIFSSYSESAILDFTDTIEGSIIPAVEAEHWKEGLADVEQLQSKWNRYKKNALLFLNTDDINEVDYTVARSVKYVQSQDSSNASGELSALSKQMRTLIDKEKVTLVNIF